MYYLHLCTHAHHACCKTKPVPGPAFVPRQFRSYNHATTRPTSLWALDGRQFSIGHCSSGSSTRSSPSQLWSRLAHTQVKTALGFTPHILPPSSHGRFSFLTSTQTSNQSISCRKISSKSLSASNGLLNPTAWVFFTWLDFGWSSFWVLEIFLMVHTYAGQVMSERLCLPNRKQIPLCIQQANVTCSKYKARFHSTRQLPENT